ncbi:MAG TPA: hypothetical protein VM243_01835 [Phycisphaerae bacterium]|nr:hypothetical protein [Phycisphaerae bacterium]
MNDPLGKRESHRIDAGLAGRQRRQLLLFRHPTHECEQSDIALTNRNVGAELPDQNVLITDRNRWRLPLVVFHERRSQYAATDVDDVADESG